MIVTQATSPLPDHCPQLTINVFSRFPAFLRELTRSAKCPLYKEITANRKHDLQHRFRKRKMRPVLIEKRLKLTAVWSFFQPLFHTPDVFAGIPQNIVFRSDAQDFSADILYPDLFLLLNRMTSLRSITSGRRRLCVSESMPIFTILSPHYR